MLNENKTQYRIITVSSSFQIQNSMLDVRCSMFIRYPDFCLLNPMVHILGDKAPYRGNPLPDPLDPGTYDGIFMLKSSVLSTSQAWASKTLINPCNDLLTYGVNSVLISICLLRNTKALLSAEKNGGKVS